MNKKTKGAIAAGAAALLLAGGAGTFAAWNDTATVTGGTITAGELKFDGTTAAGTWSNAAGPIGSIDDYRIVPGETLTYTVSPKVLVKGDNLTATITATAPTATGDLSDSLEIGTVAVSGTGVTAGAITTAADGQTLTVTVPVKFKDVTGLTDQGASAVLGDISLNLQQTTS
ncbi:alternate-type signal peptide domain-containing protein [Prescottella sp. R16]|uniref:alternate-type signal peptide domain-containing protein n=1 Tax=Prescottella sp. R16 TaxID=3064529 RepID=UPI00272E04D3|nr:alternate-type signal peptide domain-containing protein [Prescottella sp. R16]